MAALDLNRKVRLKDMTLHDVSDVLLAHGFRLGLPRLVDEDDVTVMVTKDDLRLVLANTKMRRTKAVDEAWERCYALINEEP